jgi:hypothetical protein
MMPHKGSEARAPGLGRSGSSGDNLLESATTARGAEMTQNKIVVHFVDGRILKGHTDDFLPTKPSFHLSPMEPGSQAKPAEVRVADLKAVFFVKDFHTKAQVNPRRQSFDPNRPVTGRKIRVLFKDGEVLMGTTQGYDPKRPGFFVVPADSATNNERCFVVTGSTKQVSFI